MERKEFLKYLQNNGYIIGALAKRDYIYEILADKIKKDYPYYWYLYCDIDIKKESEKIFLGEDMETRKKNFKKRFNDEKRRIIKEKYNITR